MGIELKPLPCPCCGSDAVFIDAWTLFRVRCGQCDAMGGGDLEKQNAIKKWNKRQTQKAEQRRVACEPTRLDESGLARPAQCDGESETSNSQSTQKLTQWHRDESFSVWKGVKEVSLQLIVVQNSGADESWSWTARGWREPDDDYGADKWGWVASSTREAAESAALQFYLEKDE